jgi:hypothetical protein
MPRCFSGVDAAFHWDVSVRLIREYFAVEGDYADAEVVC